MASLRHDGQRPFNGPLIPVKAHLDGLAVDAGFERPIADGLSFPSERDVASFVRVSYLRGSRRPVNIAWFVVAIIINAVKLKFLRWAGADIRQKRLKAIPPFIANGNTAPTIASIPSHALMCAAASHVMPSAPFFRFTAYSVAMSIHGVVSGFHNAIIGWEVCHRKR